MRHFIFRDLASFGVVVLRSCFQPHFNGFEKVLERNNAYSFLIRFCFDVSENLFCKFLSENAREWRYDIRRRIYSAGTASGISFLVSHHSYGPLSSDDSPLLALAY